MLSCSRRAERILVFSVGLMTLSSFSNPCQRLRSPTSISGAQLFELLFQKSGETRGGTEADVIGVLNVGACDGVGGIGRQFGILGAVADEQQIGIGRARNLEVAQRNGSCSARIGSAKAVAASRRWNCSATGRRTASDWMSLICVARN